MSYTIGDFSKQTGLSIDTLRYYEKEGLLYPERDKNDRRNYTEEDKAWLSFILKLKETAMPIKEIRKYAQLRYKGDAALGERLELLYTHRVHMLEEKKKLEETIQYLNLKIDVFENRLLNLQEI